MLTLTHENIGKKSFRKLKSKLLNNTNWNGLMMNHFMEIKLQIFLKIINEKLCILSLLQYQLQVFTKLIENK